MDKAHIARRLSEFYMFSELQPIQIEQLVSGTRVLDVPRGGTLFNRGDRAHGFYLLPVSYTHLDVYKRQ